MRNLILALFTTICFTSFAQDIPILDGVKISLTGLSKDNVISYKDLLKNDKFLLVGKNASGFVLSSYMISTIEGTTLKETVSKNSSFDLIKEKMNSTDKFEKIFIDHFVITNEREKKEYAVKDQVIKITKGTK